MLGYGYIFYANLNNIEKLARIVCLYLFNIFVHSIKLFQVNREITNHGSDDCIPTKLSEDKDRLIGKQVDVAETRSQNVDNSKNYVKMSHEYPTVPVSPDKRGKTGLAEDSSGKIARHIVYKNASPRNVDECTVADILPVYHEILQNSESMDWDGFRELIETLHPGEKELWRDVCKTVNDEAKRMAGDANGSMEVYIEISPVIIEEELKTYKSTAYAREIAFEFDMTLKDTGNFLDKRSHLVEKRLVTHKVADEGVAVRDDRARKATRGSKPAN